MAAGADLDAVGVDRAERLAGVLEQAEAALGAIASSAGSAAG